MSLNIDGWIQDTSGDPDFSSGIYKFGLPSKPEEPPVKLGLKNEVQEDEKEGQFYPTLEDGPQRLDNVVIGPFQPVNLLPFYWFFGAASDSDGTKTITHTDGTARKPTISCYQRRSNMLRQGEQICINSISIEHAFGHTKCTLTGKGLNFEAAGETLTALNQSFPSSISSVFNVIKTCTWDSGDIVLLNFKFQGMHEIDTFIDSTLKNIAMDELKVQKGVFTLQLVDNEYADFEADFLAGNKKTLVFKVGKIDASTHYFQISATLCKIENAAPVAKFGESTIWTANIKCQEVTITGIDGVANSFFDL